MQTVLKGLGRPRVAAALLGLLLIVLALENGLDFPLSVPRVVRETGHGYLDMCAFCSAASVEANLAGLGERGRLLQALLLSSIDILIPVLSLSAGLAVIAALRRSSPGAPTRALLWLPIAAFALDLAENVLIAALLLEHPAPSALVASLEGLMSGLKFVAYGAVVLAMAGLALRSCTSALRPRTVE